jgi:hypothetical protein
MATSSNFIQSVNQSFLGRAIKEGARESVGFGYAGFKVGSAETGFMGWKATAQTLARNAGKTSPRYFERMYAKKGFGFTANTALKMGMKKGGFRAAAGIGMGALGPAFFIGSVAAGFQQDGITGAATAAGSAIAFNTGIKMTASALGSPLAMAAAGIGAIGYGAYKLQKAGRQYEKRLGQLEFGGGYMSEAINSHGALTMRQRSIQALQNTHLNGRMALGNEAAILGRTLR